GGVLLSGPRGWLAAGVRGPRGGVSLGRSEGMVQRHGLAGPHVRSQGSGAGEIDLRGGVPKDGGLAVGRADRDSRERHARAPDIARSDVLGLSALPAPEPAQGANSSVARRYKGSGGSERAGGHRGEISSNLKDEGHAPAGFD